MGNIWEEREEEETSQNMPIAASQNVRSTDPRRETRHHAIKYVQVPGRGALLQVSEFTILHVRRER